MAYDIDKREVYLITAYMISTYCVNAVELLLMSAIFEKRMYGVFINFA